MTQPKHLPIAKPVNSMRLRARADFTRNSVIFAILAIGLAAALYLIDAVGAESLGVGARVTIAIVSVGLAYATANFVAIWLQNRAARAEVLEALLDLQLAASALANQSAKNMQEHTLHLPPGDLNQWSFEFAILQHLVTKNLLTDIEVMILQSWAMQFLSGTWLPPDVSRRLAEYARDLADRVGQAANLPPPPAPPAGAEQSG